MNHVNDFGLGRFLALVVLVWVGAQGCEHTARVFEGFAVVELRR